MSAARSLEAKLLEIGRRSPNDLHALETLADMVLERLGKGQVPDPDVYRWRCDDPKPKKGGA